MVLNRSLNPLLMTRLLILARNQQYVLLNIGILKTRRSITGLYIQSRHTVMSRHNASTNSRHDNGRRATLPLNNARLSLNGTDNVNVIRRSGQATTDFKRHLNGVRTGPKLVGINRRIGLLTELS